MARLAEGTYTNLAVLRKCKDVKDKYDKAGYFIDLNLEAGDDNTINILITELKVRNVKVEGNSVTQRLRLQRFNIRPNLH